MPNKLITPDCSDLIAADKPKANFSEKILEQVIKLTNRFNFINSGQWIMILIMHTICFLFMIFACILVS